MTAMCCTVHTPSQQSTTNTRSPERNVQGVHSSSRPSVAVGHSHAGVVCNNDNIHSSSSVDVNASCWALLEGRVGRGAGGEVLLLLGDLEEGEGTNNSSNSKEGGTNNSSHSEEEGINSTHSRSNATQQFKEPTRKTGNGQKTFYI
jgi:hypothetical protein